MKKIIGAALLGILFGLIATHYFLVGSYLNLFLWAIIALALGYVADTKRQSVYIGAAFGFFLAFNFMVSGYGGQAALVTRILPFALIGIVGAACGVAWALIGAYAHKLTDKK